MAVNHIAYRKELRTITGSISAAILWERLNSKFKKNPEGFWKFAAPCDHRLYKAGQSWTEELGFSIYEFRTTFSKIGIAYKSKQRFEDAKTPFIKNGKEYAFISYHDRKESLTYYRANTKLIAEISEKYLKV